MFRHKLLVVDDNVGDLQTCREFLEARGYEVDTVTSGFDALRKIKERHTAYSVIILDYRMDGMNGAETTEALLKINPDLLILIFSGDPKRDAVLLPSRQGACAFVGKNEGVDVFEAELARLCKKYEDERITVSRFSSGGENAKLIAEVGMIGCSRGLAEVASEVLRLREWQGPVLLLGESGTGKEMLALALHKSRKGPFLPMNCADFRSETVRSELFGHVKGAYTGTVQNEIGFFRAAQSGTGFLDELHELDRDIQGMLLRVIQQREVRPMGSNTAHPIHCRFVAGAKPDLISDVENGQFKLDLYSRLSETIVRIPPLRERPEDIGPLVDHFCKVWSRERGEEKTFLASTIPFLESFAWKGNVRELGNIVRSVLHSTKHKKTIGKRDIEIVLKKRQGLESLGREPRRRLGSLDAVKRSHLLEVLGQSHSIREAARKLGCGHMTVKRFLEANKLDPQNVLGVTRTDEASRKTRIK